MLRRPGRSEFFVVFVALSVTVCDVRVGAGEIRQSFLTK